MELLIMAISNIAFFIFGYKFGGKENKKITTSVEKVEETENKKREEEIKKAFNELMSYDYSTALGGGPRE